MWFESHGRAPDVTVMAIVAVVSLPWALVPDLEPIGLLTGVPAQLVCTMLAAAVFLEWRRHPLLCMAVGFGLEALTGSPVAMAVVAFGIPLYTRHRLVWTAVLFLYDIVAVPLANGISAWTYQDVVVSVLAMGAVAVAGYIVRQTAQITVLLRDRADQADKLAAQAGRQAVHDERDRLAGELHDTISYQLNLVGLHAGVIDTNAGDEDAVRRGAGVIQTAVAAAVHELHVLLDYLVEPAAEAGDRMRYLRAIPLIARDLHAAGHPVTVRLLGTPQAVPDEVDLVAYRVAQEALTNSTKYAPGAPTSLTLSFEPGVLDLHVENQAAVSAPRVVHGSGLGLRHLRGRVTEVGGSFSASMGPAGQFQVRARFPLPADQQQM